MATYENPANGYREHVGDFATVTLALLFGWMYFAVAGLWAHALIQVVVTLILAVVTGGPGAMIAIPMWFLYAFMAPSLRRGRYLRLGWREVA